MEGGEGGRSERRWGGGRALGGSIGMEALGARGQGGPGAGAGAGPGAGTGRLSWVRVGGAWVRGAPRAGAGPAVAGARQRSGSLGPRELSWVRTEKGWVRGRLAADAGNRRGRNPEPRLDHGETADLPDLGGNILGALSPSADGTAVWHGPPETEG